MQVANAAVLRLTKEAAWIAEALGALHALREGEETFIDRFVQHHMALYESLCKDHISSHPAGPVQAAGGELTFIARSLL